ncbi:hypothetical protein MTQ01_08015 [Streptomyces sp. XM4193]|uniref:hypothetical protein n=1 Tax=Streptomyces sp. XM4193 TaxID=2929782 RepID=UPI001FF7C1B9|nr:hypothetical protein [Streptomyces sp. XM4193]MCK1795948.1 hypothetical protein [Streptomyces sp. XM4193]
MKFRRARYLPAAAALLALGLTAACSGGSGSPDAGSGASEGASEGGSSAGGSGDGKNGDREDSGKGGPSPEPGSTEGWPKGPAEGELSEEELGSYALGQGDVPGFKVRIPSRSELEGMGDEKAKQAECRPLGGLMAGTPQPAPAASVYRNIMAEPDEEDPSGLVLFETLAAYDGDSADKLLSGLRKALKDCADGFETTAKGHEGMGTYKAAKELDKPKLDGADDALAFQLDADADGRRMPILFNVIRTDSTVAVFYAMNLMQPEKAVIPEAVTAVQTAKLG